jgi:hypothetical protein
MLAILSGRAELAKLGAAGAIMYGLYMAGRLLLARAASPGRPVPQGITIAHDDRGLVIYAVLVFASGALLAAVEFLPARKPDLTTEITTLDGIARAIRSAENPTRIATSNACQASPRWPEAARGFDTLKDEFERTLRALETVDRSLRAKSVPAPAP